MTQFKILKIEASNMYMIIPKEIKIIQFSYVEQDYKEPYIVVKDNKIVSFSEHFNDIIESDILITLWNTNVSMDIGYTKHYKIGDTFYESSYLGIVKKEFTYSHLPYTVYRCRYDLYIDQNLLVKIFYIDVYDSNQKKYIGIACTHDVTKYNGDLLLMKTLPGYIASSQLHKPEIPKLDKLKKLHLDHSILLKLKDKYKL